MCGIAAILRTVPAVELPNIRPMLDIVRHRGPDDEGMAAVHRDAVHFAGGPDTPAAAFEADLPYRPARQIDFAKFANAPVVLGHRRLSIVDLSPSGHQPMSTPDTRYTCVYNGEIYNYPELRSELEAAGETFVSNSDTEVVLAAYRAWGPACLHRFNGMFAIVIVDRVANELFVARDRFGIKPLYYWRSSAGFLALASEIKQFTVLPGWQAVLHGQAAYDQLQWGMIDHTPQTMFDGVRQFRGGQSCHCSLDAVDCDLPVRSWYDLTPASCDPGENAAERLTLLLEDAVRSRLRADVPVGTSLSGGLDSSSIVCLANRLLQQSGDGFAQKTFSACAHDARFDERRFIVPVVEQCQVEAHYTYPELDQLLEQVDKIIWHHDEPFESTSIFAEWEVFRLASENGVKVSLDGHGADELLAGYEAFVAPHLAGLFSGLHWVRLRREIKAMHRLHGLGMDCAAKGIANMLLPEALRLALKRRSGASSGVAWVNALALGADARDPAVMMGLKTTSVNTFSKVQLLYTSLPAQLNWADRDSMAHSIECRVPFLDHRVVEFLLGLPATMKMHEGRRKQILRDAMTGYVPQQILTRHDKMGFATPEEVWVREQNPEWFRKAAATAIEQAQGIINPAFKTIAEEIINGRRRFSFLLWRIICFGRWMERYNVRIR